jgi:beta-glucanase (GH16 family)
MINTHRSVRRLLAGTALLAVAGLAPLQVATPSEGAPADPGSAAGESDDCGAIQLEDDSTKWTCSFVDHFDGSSVDDEKWIVQRTSQTGFRTGRTCYTDSPDNVAVRDGNLVLTARKGPWVKCTVRLNWLRTRFTGGMIGTRDRFSQTYGRFEVRARFPAATTGGIHGGFWMYPIDHTYGAWPASGEIDVAEWWSYEPGLVLPSLHFDGRDPDVDSGWDCQVEDVTAFHTYTVVWDPSVIRFYIDGRTCFSRMPTPESPLLAPQPFDHDFSMILNLGVLTQGLSWRTRFPAELVVDYAKAWR